MAQTNAWNSGLCSMFADCGTCCYGCLCAPCLYGDNVTKTTGSECCPHCMLYSFCGCFACFFAGGNRSAMRSKYNLPEEPCSDCCVHCWCSPCGVCQEAREHQHQTLKT